MSRSRGSRDPPSCLFCCNVRTGTTLLAVLMLVTGLMSIVMAAIQMSTYMKNQSNVFNLDNGLENEGSNDYFLFRSNNGEYVVSQSMIVSVTLRLVLGLGFFLMIIGSLALYGLIKSRPGYLLPMLIIQLFDFLCTIATTGKALFDWPRFKMDVILQEHMGFDKDMWDPYYKEYLENLDEHWLRFSIFSFLFIALLVKYQIISVIYRCYKHITTQALLHPHDPEISSVSVPDEDLHPTIYKLPKYEEIQKVPLVMDTDDQDQEMVKPPPYSFT